MLGFICFSGGLMLGAILGFLLAALCAIEEEGEDYLE